MLSLSRYLAPAVLAASLGVAAVAAPALAQAQQSDNLVRVLVNVADVVMRGNQPYYRQGDYGYDDRLAVQRDAYGRNAYYRYVPRDAYNQSGPPYGNAYGYHRNRGYPVTGAQRTKCNKHGKCTVTYYDPRQNRNDGYADERYGNDRYGSDRYGNDRYGNDRYSDDRHDDDRYSDNRRYWDGYRWRVRD